MSDHPKNAIAPRFEVLSFIAVLDELDRRMEQSSEAVADNQEAFENLAAWYKSAQHKFEALPSNVSEDVRQSLTHLLPVLGQQVREDARTGAERGAQETQSAIQALWDETERYETRRQVLITSAKFWFPVGFISAALFGLFFGSMIIPIFPTTWEWPCQIIGTEHRYSNDPKIQTTYCLIERN